MEFSKRDERNAVFKNQGKQVRDLKSKTEQKLPSDPSSTPLKYPFSLAFSRKSANFGSRYASKRKEIKLEFSFGEEKESGGEEKKRGGKWIDVPSAGLLEIALNPSLKTCMKLKGLIESSFES